LRFIERVPLRFARGARARLIRSGVTDMQRLMTIIKRPLGGTGFAKIAKTFASAGLIACAQGNLLLRGMFKPLNHAFERLLETQN